MAEFEQADEVGPDPWPGVVRPASRAHLDLTKAVLVALEDELRTAAIGGERR